jgi:predicted RNase H-like nuclease (RuvC/YqgF family)
MKKIALIVLSIALAGAIIYGGFLYKKYMDTNDALLISEKNISELNDKLMKLNQETSSLQDQLHKNAELITQLEKAHERIPELEHAISLKDERISEYEETLRLLESWPGEKKYRMKGELKAIDLRRHTAVIEVPVKEKIFTVGGSLSSKAVLKRGGHAVQLAALQAGDLVIVIWESTKKGHVIHSLTVK